MWKKFKGKVSKPKSPAWRRWPGIVTKILAVPVGLMCLGLLWLMVTGFVEVFSMKYTGSFMDGIQFLLAPYMAAAMMMLFGSLIIGLYVFYWLLKLIDSRLHPELYAKQDTKENVDDTYEAYDGYEDEEPYAEEPDIDSDDGIDNPFED